MAKKTSPPKKFQPAPPVLKNGDLKKRMNSFVERHNFIFEHHQLWIDEYEKQFKETGNPLFVWDAFSLNRRAKLDIPVWVLKYFDEVAFGLLSPDNSIKDIPGKLKFKADSKGGPNQFRQYEKYQAQVTAAKNVALAMRDNPDLNIGGQYHQAEDEHGTVYSIASEAVKKRWGYAWAQTTIRNYISKLFTKTP